VRNEFNLGSIVWHNVQALNIGIDFYVFPPLTIPHSTTET